MSNLTSKDPCISNYVIVTANGRLQVSLSDDGTIPFLFTELDGKYYMTINSVNKELIYNAMSIVLLRDNSLTLEQSIELTDKIIKLKENYA